MEQAGVDINIADFEFFESGDSSKAELNDKSKVGCYMYCNGNLLDMMIISVQEQTLSIKFTDPSQILQIVVKDLAKDEVKYGSISIEAGLFMDNASSNSNRVWITLFDHLDDDLYDGDFTYDDSDSPRILIQYQLAGMTPSQSTNQSITSYEEQSTGVK